MLRAGLQWQAQEEEKCKGCCVFEVSHRSTPHALLINKDLGVPYIISAPFPGG
jgi:hypothetical protein